MTDASKAEREGLYSAVPAQLDLAAMDHEVLRFWDQHATFRKSWEATKDGEPWTFYEGPPTANGQPGTHHIEARVFKDVFPRFRTMQGRRVDRKAGWDCHGLPVELAVEQKIGIEHKDQIEAFGVEKFNDLCRASVQEHVAEFAELTERMGYWVNLEDAYWTMDASYVDSEWWALQQIFDKGLLTEDFRVTPYCPKDQTALSDHEVSQGYEEVTDKSVYVRMPLTSGPWAERDAQLLVWTTTPWTLVSNTAVAVRADVVYVLADNGSERLVVAEPLFDKVLATRKGAPAFRVIDTVAGRDMERWGYQRPLELVPFDKPANYIILADYVTTDDGTGLVHEAPAFGAEDMASCKPYGLPFVNPIGPDGAFFDDVPMVGGKFFKSANQPIVDDLRERGLLFAEAPVTHTYPHCWRCGTPLIYYATPSWYVRTTQIKDRLLAVNEGTNWYPEHVKHGRYGDWLENNIDWALSRSRYWGTPLPIWRNELDPSKLVCIGSRAELAERCGDPAVATMDPHRPYVDDVTFTIPGEQGVYRRVPEVIDAWFDSGSMPFAQWGYPHLEGSKEKFETHFPADFICEATDQTRGWFYSLMAVATAVFGEGSYKNVLCLGHILAEDGRKMSKHLGNILLPIPLLEDNGADAVRWFMACSGSPWSPRRVGNTTLQEVARKVLLTYWNTVSFVSLYARANGWKPDEATHPRPALADRHVLDRWLASTTQDLIMGVTADLEEFDTQHAGQLVGEFIDDLSNWYVRRSRRRFWRGDPSAFWTLHETLDALTRLLAPILPFMAEKVWQSLIVPTTPDAAESVHLASWPIADASARDEQLDKAMSLTRRLVEAGRSARSEASLKVRQPLSQALISSTAYAQLSDELLAEIAAELNVRRVDSFSNAGDVVDFSAKGNFRSLGKRFGKQTPIVANAIAGLDAAALQAALSANGVATVPLGDGLASVEVGPDDVIITERPREGWTVVNEQGETVALDLDLTPELVSDGLAREVIRGVQEARKGAGLEVSDKIALSWATDDPALAAAISAHLDLIADEVQATSIDRGTAAQGWVTDQELGLAVHVIRA